MAGESKLTVLAAIGAGLAIAAAKFVAAGVGGSSAMFSEGIHSLIDAGNDSLLLLGLRRSKKPPDEAHPFGHGKEVYFWSLVVSLTLLGAGGGVTIYEGINRMLAPKLIRGVRWSFIALGFGLVFEGISLAIALRQFRKQNPDKGFWEAVKESKDPPAFLVIGEDLAGVGGIVIAGLGIYLNSKGWIRADGIASVLIGVLLACVAVFLILETRGLLIGEGVEEEVRHGIREVVREDENITHVGTPHTMYMGPENVLVTMEVSFNRDRSAGEIADAVDRMQRAIRQRFPAVQHIYIDPE